MADSNGFIDLRVGAGARGIGDDSVWPSFTDIMTVIVMIFLMVLVVIMVRNFELDRKLLSTLSAKEATTLANQGLVERLTSLEGSLGNTQSQRDLLKANLAKETERLTALSADQALLKDELKILIGTRQQLEQDNEQLKQVQRGALAEISQLVDSERSLNQQIETLSKQFSALKTESAGEIKNLSAEKQSLNEKLDSVAIKLDQVKTLLSQSQDQNKSLSEDVTELDALKQDVEERYSIANEEILALKVLIQLREAENQALQDQAHASVSQYRSLQDEYESLDSKYRDLIRPARSAAGKYVVEVWVEKTDSGLSFKLKQPDQTVPETIESAQMHQILQVLKEQHGGALYTKIVIPENSQLSHNEAWTFTQEILQKYDYYNQ